MFAMESEAMLCNQGRQDAWLSKLAAACGGSPLLLQLTGAALANDMMPPGMLHAALTIPQDGRTMLDMCDPPF